MSDILDRLKRGLADRYRVERELGQGGMAVVYLATDLRHERPVAIKVLQPELAAVIGPQRFLREIEIAARLQHPNILPVYDSGQADGLLYYVMPYVSGESLQERLTRGGALAPEDAMQLAREVAGALDYAHRQGIVHRDIKPGNILLSEGHAQVADFGIARALSASGGPALTQAGMAIGTPAYMSPEQALGTVELDGRTDVYALGAVLYEMLAGRAPYAGTTPQAIVAQTISAPVPRLDRDALGLQAVLDRAMAKDPGERFQTSGELEAALRAPYTVGAVRRPRRTVWAAGIAAVVVAAAAFALWPRGYRVAGDPRHSLVIFPFENKTGDPARDFLEDASLHLLTLAVSHWDDLRVLDDERTGSLLGRRGVESAGALDFALAQDIAREARVGTLVLGDIRAERDTLVIEAKVHDVRSGDRLATEIVRGHAASDPRLLFDSLAARLLQMSGAPAGERPDLAAQTTRSLEAYQAYLRGVDALQQLRVDSARAALQRAVTLDSTFALAYLRLREVDGWAGIESNPERRRQWVAQAQAHSGNLPPRLRALVQFHATYESGELRRARGIVEQLIARDSSDAEAWYQLGEAHFHDRATTYPHPDTAGNLGRSLSAFRRALAIEPRYVLAYQHISDALSNCAANAPWLCLADSAVYAPQEELIRRYGADAVARNRRDAHAARIAAVAAWVEAAPRAELARSQLIRLLIGAGRIAEAQAQVATLRAGGEVAAARLWESLLLLREERYADAADTMAVAVRADPRQLFRQFSAGLDPEEMGGVLVAGGRLAATTELFANLLAAVSSRPDMLHGPGNVPMPPRMLGTVSALARATEAGVDSAEQRRLAVEWLNGVDSLFAHDSASRERATAATGSEILAAYIGTADTVLLHRALAVIDTTDSRTWRVMEAHLALARGDTARARQRIERQVAAPDSLEFTGTPGALRAFGTANLLAKMGRYREAIAVYGHLDSAEVRVRRPATHVRSFAERAALYQRLGEREQAIAMYRRFVSAWDRGDPAVQPVVTRAREAIAVLSGEPAPPPRR